MSEYLRPATLEDALAARADHPDYMILAGGTDLLVAANKKDVPAGIIDVFGLAPLIGITAEDDGAIRIGASTTYSQILASELARRELPMLCEASREIGALQIQARGTIGGNIGTSSPVGDSLPVLLALDAEVEVASRSGARTVAYDQFCTGYRTTALAADELIVAVRIPPRPDGLRQMWRKVGTRSAQSISKVMIAAAARVSDGVIDHVRIGMGAVAAQPIRADKVEAVMQGARPDASLGDAVRAAVAEQITPIDDVRSTARYRLRVAQNVLVRFALSLGGE